MEVNAECLAREKNIWHLTPPKRKRYLPLTPYNYGKTTTTTL